jgi:hypothetical protein
MLLSLSPSQSISLPLNQVYDSVFWWCSLMFANVGWRKLLWFDFIFKEKNTQAATSTHTTTTPSQIHFKSVTMRLRVCLS